MLPIYSNITRKAVNDKVVLPPGTSADFSVRYQSVVGSKQTRPITLCTPYSARFSEAKWLKRDVAAFGANYGADQFLDVYSLWPTELARAQYRAYEALRNAMYSQASVGTALAEYSQSLAMISQRGKQLLDAARSLRRGDISGLLKGLQLQPSLANTKRFQKSKTFGKTWLEFHFGWEPLIKDIYDASVVISSPINTVWAKGKGSEPINLISQGGNPTSLWQKEIFSGDVRSVQMCSGSITNPNLHLAEQMGLVNPLSIAWELVPFSFVVDWYVNVGDYLRSVTDFAGMTLSDPYHTDIFRVTQLSSWDAYDYPYNGNFRSDVIERKFFNMARGPGLISSTLVSKGIHLPSSTRAATQISLLVQFLKSR